MYFLGTWLPGSNTCFTSDANVEAGTAASVEHRDDVAAEGGTAVSASLLEYHVAPEPSLAREDFAANNRGIAFSVAP